MREMRKALLIGLDCAAPDLLFNRVVDKLRSSRAPRACEKKRIIK